jgi:hypothetical protein
MAINKKTVEISEQDLQSLIAASVREGKTIEYKREISIGMDDQKRKFLGSVASFANAAGGDLIFGIAAQEGIPTGIAPLKDFEPDRDTRLLRDLIRAHIRDPLFGIEFKEVPVADGMALVLRIPKAWDGGRMVTFGNDYRFYTRDANGKVLMNVPEIRASFLAGESIGPRMRGFRAERLSLIRSGETAVKVVDGPKLVIHVFPFRSFEPAYQADLGTLLKSGSFKPMQVYSSYGPTHDLDGTYTYEHLKDGAIGYSAALRNGCLEVVQRIGMRDKILGNPGFEAGLIKQVAKMLEWLPIMSIESPIAVMVSLLDVNGFSLYFHPEDDFWGSHPIKPREIITHDVVLNAFADDNSGFLRPICDSIWQACGLERSFNFNQQGQWNPRRPGS